MKIAFRMAAAVAVVFLASLVYVAPGGGDTEGDARPTRAFVGDGRPDPMPPHDLPPGHAACGFVMGNPAELRIRAADGPLDFHLTPVFLNWEHMPALPYRFVATAWRHGTDGEGMREPVFGPATIQAAGQSAALDDGNLVALPVELPPGDWTVLVTMHEIGRASGAPADRYLPNSALDPGFVLRGE